MTPYLKQNLISASQGINTLTGGMADECFSSRCYRLEHRQPFKVLRPMIDVVATWFGDIDHCRRTYENELMRMHFPASMRNFPRMVKEAEVTKDSA